MNDQLQRYARETLKEGLSQCTDDQQMLFKRMYANGDLSLPIAEVVDRMPEGKLDWAMKQVSNTLKNNKEK